MKHFNFFLKSNNSSKVNSKQAADINADDINHVPELSDNINLADHNINHSPELSDDNINHSPELSDDDSDDDYYKPTPTSLIRSKFCYIMADIGDEIPRDMHDLWDKTIDFTEALIVDKEEILDIVDYVNKQKEHDDILKGFEPYFDDFCRSYVSDLWEDEKLNYVKKNIAKIKDEVSGSLDSDNFREINSKISLLKGVLESIYRVCEDNQSIYTFLTNEKSEIKDIHDCVGLDNKYKSFNIALKSFLPVGDECSTQNWGDFFSNLWIRKRLDFLNTSNCIRLLSDEHIFIDIPKSKDERVLFEKVFSDLYIICSSNKKIYDFLECKEDIVKNMNKCMHMEEDYKEFSSAIQNLKEHLEHGTQARKCAEFFGSYFLELWCDKGKKIADQYLRGDSSAFASSSEFSPCTEQKLLLNSADQQDEDIIAKIRPRADMS